MLTSFGWNFEIEDRCKGVHCVDLGESFPTSIYLQNLASIQPRTGPISRSVSNITIVNHLFVPLRYLQFLKIVRSTAAAAAAENEPCKVCPLSAYRSPQVLATSVALSNGGERRHILRLGQPELLHQGQLPARAAGEASGSDICCRPGHVQSFGYLAADFGVKKIQLSFSFRRGPKYQNIGKISKYGCYIVFWYFQFYFGKIRLRIGFENAKFWGKCFSRKFHEK